MSLLSSSSSLLLFIMRVTLSFQDIVEMNCEDDDGRDPLPKKLPFSKMGMYELSTKWW